MNGIVQMTCALALVAAVSLTVSSCDDDSPDEAATDAAWVSGFCKAALRLGDETSKVTPSPGGERITSEMLKAMAPSYAQFADDLGKLDAPDGIEDYHRKFVDGAKETAEIMAKGDVTVDPWRALEELEPPTGFSERFGPLAAADDDCKRAGITFAESGPEATPTPAPPGSFAPPAINYNDPGKFLVGGPQSTLSERSIQVLRTEVMPAQGTGAARIYAWMARTFTTRAAGGATIGAGEVNQLISSRELSGCHDWALVMTATLRFFGYPALMVDTAGLQWAEDYASGKTQAFSGHVFAEVLTNEGWMLVDCTAGRYTLDYDPANPVIPPSGAGDAKGYYALYKGIDPASYGVTSNQVLQERMSLFAGVLATLELEPPDYDWQSFQ